MKKFTELWENMSWDAFVEFLINEAQTNDFFAAAGLAGVLGIFWTYFKGVPKYMWDRVQRRITFTSHIYQTDEFYGYFEQWLRDNHTSSYRNVEVVLKDVPRPITDMEGNLMYYEDDLEEDETPNQQVNFSQFIDLFFIRRGIFWLRVYKGREKMENVTDLRMAYLNRFQVSGIFAKKAISKLYKEVLDYNIKLKRDSEKKTIDIYTNSSDYWSTNDSVYPKHIDSIILENKDELLKDVDNFLDNRNWYMKRNISYKRGYMFYGEPGNGKTSLAMSLAQRIKRNLYMMTISKTMDDGQLIRLFRNMATNSVLVIEDIDAVFGTKRKKKDSSFSFSTLLNCLDGVLSKEDIIVIFTTNHPEKLDSALIREGRIDFKMEVGNPTKEGIEEYLNIFYERDDADLDMMVHKKSPIPMVEVQNICLNNKRDYTNAINSIEKRIKEKL